MLFNPYSVAEIAEALARLTVETGLRAELCAHGTRRLQDFNLTRTGRAYRAVYRRAAGVPLDATDEMLLQWNWMRDPMTPPAVQSKKVRVEKEF